MLVQGREAKARRPRDGAIHNAGSLALVSHETKPWVFFTVLVAQGAQENPSGDG